MLNIFSCVRWPSVIFGKMSIQVLYTAFFNQGKMSFFFNVELYEFLYILHINSLSDLSFSNILSPTVGCFFVDDFLCSAKAFSLI